MTSPSVRYSLTYPEGWLALPSPDELPDAGSVARFVNGFDLRPEARNRFRLDLTRAVEFARLQNRPDRRRWIYMPESLTGTIVATMTVDLTREPRITPQKALDSVTAAAPPDGTDVWSRSFGLKRIAGARAITGDELVQVRPPDDGTSQLIESYRAILFTPVPDVVLTLVISTYDLAQFDDIVGYGDRVVESIKFLRESDAA